MKVALDIAKDSVKVTHVNCIAFSGIEAINVDVQVHISNGLPCFNIVGLPDKIVAESRERIKAALSAIGINLPPKRIIVNLAPADLAKEGSHYDLAIAAALLARLEIVPETELQEYIIVGELSLDSSINSVPGILPAAVFANQNNKGIICAYQNGKEAKWAGEINIIAPNDLVGLINHFRGLQSQNFIENKGEIISEAYPDFADVKGQKLAKRAFEIAAAGGHNLLMSGPPGVGKSMLASRMVGILPKLSSKEILECSMISSIVGDIKDGNLYSTPPFRAPHHSSSMAAMVGGGVGKKVKPGEITLAHNGVLFLDELPEFQRPVLDALRQPLETGNVTVARVNSHVSYPAKFQLIAAMNPCKCGYFGFADRECSKSPKCSIDYLHKISGPLIDRMDIFIDVEQVNYLNIQHNNIPEEDSKILAERVKKARELQQYRFNNCQNILNARAEGSIIENSFNLTDEGQKLLLAACDKMSLSMRAINKVLKVARTIADLSQNEEILKIHIAEAISFRKSYF